MQCSRGACYTRFHFVAPINKKIMSEIFQIKYQFIFGGYLQLACGVGVILELMLIGLRHKNRQQSRPESARYVPLMVLFAVLLTSVDYLRGFGIVEVPQFRDFTPVYRPEALWYLSRAIVTTFAVVGFAFFERAIYRKFRHAGSRNEPIASSSVFGGQPKT